MRRLASKILSQPGLALRMGLSNYLRYRLTARGKTLSITYRGHRVTIRKGALDLAIALVSLDGEFDELHHYLPPDYNGTIVDAGGYIGTSVLALRGLFPAAKIIVLEPSRGNLEILRRNTAGLDNLEIINAALVGKKPKGGKLILRDRGTGECGFTVVAGSADSRDAAPLHETPAITLRDLGIKPAKIGLLKLDIEGAEAELIRNDSATLKKIKIIFAELHDRIDPDCTRLFFEFSVGRKLRKSDGEKYISVGGAA